MLNKKYFTALSLAAVLAFGAGAERSVTFDFHNPETLTPNYGTPGLKEAISMDQHYFEADGVRIYFEACDYGNTHVRLYGSYDAGVDMRIYDGDMMIVEALNPDEVIKGMSASLSLSGISTGASDINFLATPGEWVWEDDAWYPGDTEEPIRSVELTSLMQSRLYDLTVVVDSNTAISTVVATQQSEPQWYTLDGRKIAAPTAPGLYLRLHAGHPTKVIM